MQPSLNLELVVDVPDTSEKDKKPKQELIATEDNGAGTLTNLVIRVTLWISGLQVILFL
jgi:predicted neuraminidase